MANQHYSNIIHQLQPLFDEQGFQKSPDVEGVYLNDRLAVKILYDEGKKMFLLYTAPVAEGEGVDFKEAAGWLFDESHTEKDAAVIAEDFAKVIKEALGIAPVKSAVRQDVALPSRNAVGIAPGVEAFAKRFMDIFPQYKEVYKADVAKYGEFLYDDFFKKTATAKLRELTSEAGFNKKHLTKLFDLLNEMYAEGDKVVTDTVMFTILGGAFGDDPARFEAYKEYYADCPYIKQNGRIMIEVIAHNKKYKEALGF